MRVPFFCFCLCVFGYLWREHQSEGGQLDRSGTSASLSLLIYVYGCIYCSGLHAGVRVSLVSVSLCVLVYLWREHLLQGGELDRSGGAHISLFVTSYICTWMHL